MKPPGPTPLTASRRHATRTRTGRGRARRSGKTPKRLASLSPLARGSRAEGQGSKIPWASTSPAEALKKPPPPDSALPPPPPPPPPSSFSLSFGSDFTDDVISYMDRLDRNPVLSSTPLEKVSKVSDTKTVDSPLFDASSLDDSTRGVAPPSFLATPARGVGNPLSLASWGLPDKVLEQYAKRGITSMFEWQSECLLLPNVLAGGNLVYSAPTSAGKTLVAELLALKCVLELKKKVIIILPFVSIAQEKSSYLQAVFEPVGVKVGGFMGGQAPSGGFAAVDIAICTIEKANSLVNRLLEENSTHQLGTVVVDELHMIGDPHRGYLLELLLTKLMYVCKKGRARHGHKQLHPANPSSQGGTQNGNQDGTQNGIQGGTQNGNQDSTQNGIQLIGMSATLPNLDSLAKWLEAGLYRTDFRPVPLREMVKIGPTLYDTDLQKLWEYDKRQSYAGDEDDILLVCQQRVVEGHSVLIFCPTKSWCENLAATISGAPFLRNTLSSSADQHRPLLEPAGLKGVCEQLRRTQVGLDPVLQRCLPSGVAFHHAGLTFDEREIIEGAFRRSLIKILVATSTLSSGVNLPARLVIVRTPFFQRSLLDVLVYKQMIGRAGRMGVDECGESILICKESERARVVGLLQSAPKPVRSCLGEGGRTRPRPSGDNLAAMKRALLEIVASGTATSDRDIETYISCTLLFTELTGSDTDSATRPAEGLLSSTMQFLMDNEFVAVREAPDGPRHPGAPPLKEYYATQLGAATVASSLSPSEALVVFSELRRARKSFVLESELHIVYLVTPVYIQNQWPAIDWYRYLCVWERLPPDLKHVAETLGIAESFLARAVQGRVSERTQSQRESLRVHRRFFTALALNDLVHEVPIKEVARKYGASKGLLQTLQGAAGTFAGMVTAFCSRLGWSNLELLLSQFQNRLMFGIERELCDLVRVSLLNGFRARVLYNAGFHTLPSLATANPTTIETCLRKAVPFKSHRYSDNDTCGVATTWCARLRRGLSESEAARLIVKEAQVILSQELNIPAAAWSSSKPETANLSLPPLQTYPSKGPPSGEETLGSLQNAHKREENSEIVNVQSHCSSPVHTTNLVSSDTKLKQAVPEETAECCGSGERALGSSDIHTRHPGSPPPCSSPDFPFTIPDSVIMDMSMNFTFRSNSTPVANPATSTLGVVPVSSNEQGFPHCHSEQVNPVTCVAESPIAPERGARPAQEMADRDELKPSYSFPPLSMSLSFSLSQPASLKDLSSLCSSQISQSGVTIIEVTSNPVLFETFVSESLEQKSVSFSVATLSIDQGNGIGCTVVGPRETSGLAIPLQNKQVVGVAFCWGELDVYYVSLCPDSGAGECIALEHRIGAVRTILSAGQRPHQQLVAYDAKSHAKTLALTCGVFPSGRVLDPTVASWMLDPDAKEKTIHKMVLQYLPEQPVLSEGEDIEDTPLSSLATHSSDPQIQAAADSVLASLLLSKLSPLLAAEGFSPAFHDVEMPSLMALTKMELSGIGFSSEECTRLKDCLQLRLTELEKAAYSLARRSFSLTSPEDVAQILFLELKLPSPSEGRQAQQQKTLGPNSRRSKRRIKHLSTAKDVLEKIKSLHPLPGVILEWRRISSTVTKTIFPLFKGAILHEHIGSTRIHPCCQIHTATGRVSLSDPSLQMVPKEFDIGPRDVPRLSTDSAEQGGGPSLLSESQCLEVCHAREERVRGEAAGCQSDAIPSSVCMRDVFVAFPGGVFLAADYSQLELRILAHMSGDKKLQRFLNSEGDVFKMIAGEWLAVPPESVSDKQRQEAKQVCYGMVYGIGSRALGEQLSVQEEEAARFIETFKSRYPTMRKFLSKTMESCKVTGQVCTLLGRKRFLPAIHSQNSHARSQAERQAVNTTIQGSAADLVKTAMVNIDRKLTENFPNLPPSLVAPRGCGPGGRLAGAYLVLQLHDELVYEVAEGDLREVAHIVQHEMEGALELSVKFPVKMKVGQSWGKMKPYLPT